MLDDTNPSELAGSVFPENRFEAVEEIGRLLGLTPDNFAFMLKLLCKSCFSNLSFDFGDLSVELHGHSALCGDEEISLSFSLRRERFARSVEYWFKPSDLGVHAKQRRINDFEEG